MIKRSLFVSMAAALLFSACQPMTQPETIADGALKGTIEQPVVDGFGVPTRAGFGDNFAFNWKESDEIRVLTSAGNKSFILSSGAGSATGSFVGSLSSGETISDKLVYPYASSELTSDNTSMTLPAVYNYGTNDQWNNIPVMLPCWAPIDNNSFAMKHLVGYLAFEISNIPAGANTFVLTTTDKRINGAFEANLTATDPCFEAVGAANDAEKTVTINFTVSSEVSTHRFVVPVPVGTYTYRWYIKTNEQLNGFGSGENVSVGRGQIKGSRVACAQIGGGEPGSGSDPEPQPDPYNGHAYVDLGLSVKWATMNIGAAAPEGDGDYFAWAATEPLYEAGHAQDNPQGNWKSGQAGYTWANTPYQTATNPSYLTTKWTKYLGNISSSYKDPSATDVDASKNVLDLEDDAARVNWGGDWRMPTYEEMIELNNRDNCTWEWITINGVSGQKIQSKKDGYTENWIFIPAAHYRELYGLYWDRRCMSFWSSSLDVNKPYNAYVFFFDELNFYQMSSYRMFGLPIRPVCP